MDTRSPMPILRHTGKLSGRQRRRLRAKGYFRAGCGILASPLPKPDPRPWELADHAYLAAILAANRSSGSDLLFTGLASAFLHGVPLLRTPASIDAYRTPATQSRARFGPDSSLRLVIRKPAFPHGTGERDRASGLRHTAIVTTLTDIARFAADDEEAVVAMNSLFAHLEGMAGGYRSTLLKEATMRRWEDISGRTRAILDSLGPHTGRTRALRRLGLASPLCDSPAESRFLLAVRRLGFASPEQQVPISTFAGERWADFLWPRERIVVEVDGDLKFLGPDANRRILAERKRNLAIEEAGYRLRHVEWRDLDNDTRLRAHLEAAGVPRRRSRSRRIGEGTPRCRCG